MKRFFMFTCLALLLGSVQAQKKSTLKDADISSKIEWQFVTKNGTEVKLKEAEFKYDREGNVVMEKNWDQEGLFKNHFEYTYDTEGNILTQISYNEKKQVLKKEVYTYKGKLKMEKKTYNADGKLLSRKVYEYISF